MEVEVVGGMLLAGASMTALGFYVLKFIVEVIQGKYRG